MKLTFTATIWHTLHCYIFRSIDSYSVGNDYAFTSHLIQRFSQQMLFDIGFPRKAALHLFDTNARSERGRLRGRAMRPVMQPKGYLKLFYEVTVQGKSATAFVQNWEIALAA